MRPSLIKTVLSQDMPGSSATIGVALGLINTLSTDVANDLSEAQQALGTRRRQQHDKMLANAIIQAESLAYVARWLGARVRPARASDDLPIVITDLHDVSASAITELDA